VSAKSAVARALEPTVKATLSIASRELRNGFIGPFGWLALSMTQFIIGVVFVVRLQLFLDPPRAAVLSSYWGLTRIVSAPLYEWLGFLFLLLAPLLTMRALNTDRQGNMNVVLLLAPLPSREIVIGKFLAILGFYGIQICLVTLLPISLLSGGRLDWGLLGAQVMGIVLLGSAFAAFGVWISTLVREPAPAAVICFAVLLLSWLLSWRSGRAADPSELQGDAAYWIHYLSWQRHLEPFLRGLVDTGHAAFFLLLDCACLLAATWRLERVRRSR